MSIHPAKYVKLDLTVIMESPVSNFVVDDGKSTFSRYLISYTDHLWKLPRVAAGR